MNTTYTEDRENSFFLEGKKSPFYNNVDHFMYSPFTLAHTVSTIKHISKF